MMDCILAMPPMSSVRQETTAMWQDSGGVWHFKTPCVTHEVPGGSFEAFETLLQSLRSSHEASNN